MPIDWSLRRSFKDRSKPKISNRDGSKAKAKTTIRERQHTTHNNVQCTYNNFTHHNKKTTIAQQQCTYLIVDFINMMLPLQPLQRLLPIPTPILILLSECNEHCVQILPTNCPPFNVAPTLTALTKQPCTTLSIKSGVWTPERVDIGQQRQGPMHKLAANGTNCDSEFAQCEACGWMQPKPAVNECEWNQLWLWVCPMRSLWMNAYDCPRINKRWRGDSRERRWHDVGSGGMGCRPTPMWTRNHPMGGRRGHHGWALWVPLMANLGDS